ncbi:MAG: LapA family protein [Solirubrobacteraceae bacterium]|jgi:uncharacterized integral membrane protein
MFHRATPELIDPPLAASPAAPTQRDVELADAEPQPAPAEPQPAPAAPAVRETRRARAGRMAHRTRLHIYALLAVLVLVYVVALATTNTHRVRVDWVFAHSTVPLVWLTLFAAILGWLLGILITMLFRMWTREPRPPVARAPSPSNDQTR